MKSLKSTLGGLTLGWLSVLAAPSIADTVTVYEFYNAGLKHYFRTADAVEAAAIDQGAAGPGWVRTGDDFLAYSSSAALAGGIDVCRFYGSIFPGPNSHFYTAGVAECNALKALQLSTPAALKRWNYEGFAFAVTLPAAGGCAGGTSSIYRLYNNGFASGADSNHRYTTLTAEYARLQAAGWIGEGIVMCGATASSCLQAANFPDVSLRVNYIDKNLDGKTFWDASGSTQPSTNVSCANGMVNVTSPGLPNFDAIGNGRGGADAAYRTLPAVWKFPQNPAIAAQTTTLRNVLGPIALMVNGVQIYGPVEAPIDNFADPNLAGLLNYCGGHVDQYHFHAFPECFFNQKTLGGTSTFLPAMTPGIVLGYALDGFPILTPYEACVSGSANCVDGIREIQSAYRYTGTGAYVTEGAFNVNVYESGYRGSPLDACNGRTDASGRYAYYATRQFPYFLACYRGTKATQ